MHSIYIQLWLGIAATPLIVHMHVRLGGVAIVCDYPHPAIFFHVLAVKWQRGGKNENTYEVDFSTIGQRL